MTTENRYFIAIVPPDDVSGQITSLKEEAHKKYGSGHALRSPPHITLFMPFLAKDKKLVSIEKKLAETANTITPFPVSLRGFDCFEPRVVFVNVVENESLSQCFLTVQKNMRLLNLANASYKNRAFHPHVTIAFRDLKKPQFYEAWSDYKERAFEASFLVADLVLLKHIQNPNPYWEILSKFPLT